MKIESISSSIFKIGGASYTKGDYIVSYDNLAITNGIQDESKSIPKITIASKITGQIVVDQVDYTSFRDSGNLPYSSFDAFSLDITSMASGGAISVGPTGPTGPQGPVGPAGLFWKGTWVSGTSYVLNDAVGYNGASYFCILATSGTTTPNLATTAWALLASQGAVGPAGATGATGATGPTGAVGPAGGAGTLQQTVANGNTITDSYNTMTVTAESIKTSNPLGGKVEIVGGISTAKPYLKFGLPSSAGKTVTLTSADSQAASRTIKLPDADGTIALDTYKETVILLSYDGTNFTYTNAINQLNVTITFSVFSGTLNCTLSSSVLTEDKTIIWASSFVEFGGYLTQASRNNGTSFTLSLTNTNGTNNTFPTSFTNLPIRIQVYN